MSWSVWEGCWGVTPNTSANHACVFLSGRCCDSAEHDLAPILPLFCPYSVQGDWRKNPCKHRGNHVPFLCPRLRSVTPHNPERACFCFSYDRLLLRWCGGACARSDASAQSLRPRLVGWAGSGMGPWRRSLVGAVGVEAGGVRRVGRAG